MTRRERVVGQEPPVDLMNTVWGSGKGTEDALATADGAREWIREIVPRLEQRPRSLDHWLPCASALSVKETAFDLRRLRDALRRLAADATADERPAGVVSDLPDRQAAVATLNTTAARAAASSALVWPGAGVPTIALQGDLPGGIAVSCSWRSKPCGFSAAKGGSACGPASHRAARTTTCPATDGEGGARRLVETGGASRGSTTSSRRT